jgi:hypothetical protein
MTESTLPFLGSDALAAGTFTGIIVHCADLDDEEICVIDGIPVTTPARTAFDLGRRDTVSRAVIRDRRARQCDGIACHRCAERGVAA